MGCTKLLLALLTCAAFALPVSTVRPGHRANILDCRLRETGVGYVEDPGDALNYGTYWIQDFGTR